MSFWIPLNLLSFQIPSEFLLISGLCVKNMCMNNTYIYICVFYFHPLKIHLQVGMVMVHVPWYMFCKWLIDFIPTPISLILVNFRDSF